MKRIAMCLLGFYLGSCSQASEPSGIITTIAGGVPFTFPTNVTLALNAPLGNTQTVAVDSQGNIYLVDSGNSNLFRVSPGGTITTVTEVAGAAGIAVDASGNLFIADRVLIYKVSGAGVITTVAGNGSQGFSGEGRPATSASLFEASGVPVDTSGNLFIADTDYNRVRKVSASGIVTTVAGNRSSGFSGDGGPAVAASLDSPQGVVVDASGNFFFADTKNGWIREVSASVIAAALSIAHGGIVPVYSTVPTIQPGEWVTIYGNNLASSSVTLTENYTTILGGTSVTINGKTGYLWFVSPTQINLRVPTDTATGSVPVVVTTPNGTATSTVTLAQFRPSFGLLDSKHVAGIMLRSNGAGAYGGGTYDIIGPTGGSIGYPTVAAMAGDEFALFAVGLEPTLRERGSNLCRIAYQGLYQINLIVPAGLGKGMFRCWQLSAACRRQLV